MAELQGSHRAGEPSFHRLEEIQPGDLPPLALALGVFDGVHRGHQALIAAAQRAAVRSGEGTRSAALTFDPHPAAIFAPGRVPAMLTPLEERLNLLHRYGAEVVIVAHFDRALAAQTPDEFVHRILRDTLNVRAVIVGDDFRFGCERTGDVRFLRQAARQYGFALEVITPVFIHGVPARSTGIRQMIAGGEVEEAARLLGRDYCLSGEVVTGRQLGRTLGYPTANLATEPGVLIPDAGVYACWARLADGSRYRAAVSVGANITIAPDAPRTVEAYLMDGFHGDLYGQRIVLEFAHRLRAMEKFDSLEALTRQMAHDVDEAAHRLI